MKPVRRDANVPPARISVARLVDWGGEPDGGRVVRAAAAGAGSGGGGGRPAGGAWLSGDGGRRVGAAWSSGGGGGGGRRRAGGGRSCGARSWGARSWGARSWGARSGGARSWGGGGGSGSWGRRRTRTSSRGTGGGGGGGGGGHPTRPGSGAGVTWPAGGRPREPAMICESPGRELIRTGGRGGAGARGSGSRALRRRASRSRVALGVAPPFELPLPLAVERLPAARQGRQIPPLGFGASILVVQGARPGVEGHAGIGLVRLRGLLVVLVVELPTAAHPFMLVQAPGSVQYRPAAPATRRGRHTPGVRSGSCGTSRFPASGCR